MEIILNKTFCRSLTGSLNKRHGYSIRGRNGRFFSVRKNRHIPYWAHLDFIFDCADLAGSPLIEDILISADEFRQAINEAKKCYGDQLAQMPPKNLLHADDVLNYRKRWLL